METIHLVYVIENQGFSLNQPSILLLPLAQVQCAHKVGNSCWLIDAADSQTMLLRPRALLLLSYVCYHKIGAVSLLAL